MTHHEPLTVEIIRDADVVLAETSTRSLLDGIGFDGLAVDETALVARELATNIIEHAGEGRLTMTPLHRDRTVGVEIVAEDSGPGFAEVEEAVVDGISTSGSLGGGLGTVHRLMDDVTIDPGGRDEGGARITARRWKSANDEEPPPPVDVGGATRSMPSSDRNGDTFLVEHLPGVTLTGIIDGLGHGEEAHRASHAAARHVRTHVREPMADLFAGVETACRSTRGVVMLLARFDHAEHTVEFGGVGNIGARCCHPEGSDRPLSRRGVLGHGADRPRVETRDWPPDTVLVLHSDGVTSRWDCNEVLGRDDQTAAAIAGSLLRTLAKPTDDATVVVAKAVSP